MIFDNQKYKAVVWGFKLKNNLIPHTHSSIHKSFVKAFKHLGYETLWLDDNDDVSNINFDNCIFLTEGQCDAKIPINNSAYYILHNCSNNASRYVGLPSDHKLNLQFFHKAALERNLTKVNDYTYIGGDVIHIAWATDLLPHEIDENNANNEKNNKQCVWVGSYDRGDRSAFQNNTELDPYFDECRKNNIKVRTSSPWGGPISDEENRNLVHSSYLSPAIQGPWQIDDLYIPCRIFKHISYGHIGITNNAYVHKIFGEKLVYSRDPIDLFHKSIEKKNSPNCLNEIKSLMNEVKEKHTYINRINSILECFK